ncbi:bifunctional N-acetylglucosamine-1-phosphate uridyltransferase/glucosamine-1-phosphate acetyltransferase [Mesotoga sp. Brook.08.YT.4.2.5.1]|uniref:bifunctional UDP-N-acetylglucosamine diphosphorylase/glucosamine-1-phosphate N-acetyltransferase GlmU n=1 Tax=unclassified Mesotoga TaxID=1184398 RepID=UPI000C9A9045|nr:MULTISPECIES: bifunctional UDP-N-acetylglucosamine diphosphorylase/glucosamine-1-phosphate N-acetyltransferase GlmU [unclassified Mesotoga]PNE18082.1 bifunctional N-acetylglucosamine-1-phosphate uridyltransferase/glucosamine-1-phosphate acetyltransferase [Mesotoga sp. Brook.08.YT.4.2.5.1]RAM58733.1 bifunctional N-acetylglucosamine-1-phosphate uridyltransferase/glucosamine-1-phosphate acetyltransferase [Mesotoga sp. SC_4PWL113PWK15]RAO96803.1 N-acetylglucosamine-1-phosphate uridyltransferase [
MTGIILAAGQGKRMKSRLPKVIHRILDRPMINWVAASLRRAGVDRIVVVTGFEAERVEAVLDEDVLSVRQIPQLGTGHAVMTAAEYLDDEEVVVVAGDEPLVRVSTLEKLILTRRNGDYDVVFLTMKPADPTGYGRVVKTGDKIRIVEHRDADQETRKIDEVNTAIYAFKGSFLRDAVKRLSNDNDQKEYYLTDTVAMAERADTIVVEDTDEVLGVNDRIQLAEITRIAKKRINEEHMRNGVTMVDPETCYIGPDVEIGIDSVIEPMVFITGKTRIGDNCLIGPMTRIENAIVEDDVEIIRSEVDSAEIRSGARVGPFSRLRPGAVVMNNAHVGNYVELKKTVLGKGSKAQHLTYLGDTNVGENVNIGAGTITCNYDGKNKYKTEICNGAFIGSNTSLVAPVKIGERSVTAAGSAITEDVPPDSLAFGRARQVVKEGRYPKNRGQEEKN